MKFIFYLFSLFTYLSAVVVGLVDIVYIVNSAVFTVLFAVDNFCE